MTLRRWLYAFTVLAIFAGAAYVAQRVEPAGVKMATAADKFLATLSPEQKAKATFAFDDKERFNWHFVPLQDKDRKSTRKGLPLEAMEAKQREAALELLRASTTADGFQKATTIMSLEAILQELEKGGTNVRSPDWYFFAIFGKPSSTGRWGFRVEGHHLSLNFTLENGQMVSATPAFLGANPAIVMDGPRKGLRTLAAAEELAIDLFKSLSEEQKKVALQEKQLPEVRALNQLPEIAQALGLPAEKMNAEQKATLSKLLAAYLQNLPTEFAGPENDRIQQAGFDKIHFAYAGGVSQGQPHTYRIQGPTFVIEFLNIQADSARNPANHIHSCYRSLKNDFGLSVARGQ